MLPASAQQPDPADVDTTARTDTTRAVGSAERKSPGRAVLYSSGGTVLLTPLLIGPIIGPSFGHFYAEANDRAWRGIAIRGGGVSLVGILAVRMVLTSGTPPDELRWDTALANVLLYAVLGHAVYDSVSAWHSAKDYNEAHALSARVTPIVRPQGQQVGLSMRVTF